MRYNVAMARHVASLAVVADRSASHDEWQDLWDADESAIFFQSPTWAELMSEYTDRVAQPASRLLTFSDASAALIPLMTVRSHRGLVTQQVSSPAWTPSGWLSADNLSADHAEAIAMHLLATTPDLRWLTSPVQPLGDPASPPPSRLLASYMVDLRGGESAIRSGWSKGHRAAFTFGVRNGLRVRQGASPGDWDAYYDLYLASLRRWGERATSSWDRRLFALLARLDPVSTKLWLAEREGECLSGAVCFYAGRHFAYWHGAADGDHFRWRPSNVLLSEVMLRGAAEGFRWFDMGPSGGHEGVTAFKRRFGAQPHRMAGYEARSGWARLVHCTWTPISRLVKRRPRERDSFVHH